MTMRALPVLLVPLILAGCERADVSDLEAFIVQARTQAKGQVEPLPAIPTPETYHYRPEGLRDPFQPPRARLQAATPTRLDGGTPDLHPDADRVREPLESYPLESLTMVGVLRNGGEIWAVIRAPDNTLYRVRKGNYLGQNHGRIIAIGDNEVKIMELVPDGAGGWMERPNSLSLNE